MELLGRVAQCNAPGWVSASGNISPGHQGQDLSCPGAPRKLTNRLHPSVFLASIEMTIHAVGESLKCLEASQRHALLACLPSYAMEDLFLAYCLWYSGTHPRPFDCLLQLAPDLDEQLVSYALAGGGGGVSQCTWEQWEALLLRAAADPAGAGRQAARALFGQQAGVISGRFSSKPSCCRVLTF